MSAVTLRFSEQEAAFLREVLRYGRTVYSEAGNKYLDTPGYKETVFNVQLAQYDAMILRLRSVSKGARA